MIPHDLCLQVLFIESFFSTVFCLDIKDDKFDAVLNDHLFEMQTKLIPLFL